MPLEIGRLSLPATPRAWVVDPYRPAFQSRMREAPLHRILEHAVGADPAWHASHISFHSSQVPADPSGAMMIVKVRRRWRRERLDHLMRDPVYLSALSLAVGELLTRTHIEPDDPERQSFFFPDLTGTPTSFVDDGSRSPRMTFYLDGEPGKALSHGDMHRKLALVTACRDMEARIQANQLDWTSLLTELEKQRNPAW